MRAVDSMMRDWRKVTGCDSQQYPDMSATMSGSILVADLVASGKVFCGIEIASLFNFSLQCTIWIFMHRAVTETYPLGRPYSVCTSPNR